MFALLKKHPEYSYTALVRTEEKGNLVKRAFPNVRTVQGDNDSSDLLREESAKADIVIRMNTTKVLYTSRILLTVAKDTADASDHEGAAKAIAAGLAQGHSEEKPGYWLHTGGTGILTYFDSKDGKTGEESDKEFNDFDGVDELVNLPHEAFHRNIDEIVLECGIKNASSVKTAIVCPPTIYGVGRGPSLTRGRQVYELAKATLELKKGPILGAGKARWNNVHVHDLAQAFILLVEAAAEGRTDDGLWGDRGYYFTEDGEHYWGLLSEWIAKTATDLGYMPEALTENLDEEKAKSVAGFESLSWGWNSRGKAERLRKLLGWEAKERSIEDEVPTIVRSEWERLQKK